MTLIRLARSEDVDGTLEVGREAWEATYVPLAGEAYVRKVLPLWCTTDATSAGPDEVWMELRPQAAE